MALGGVTSWDSRPQFPRQRIRKRKSCKENPGRPGNKSRLFLSDSTQFLKNKLMRTGASVKGISGFQENAQVAASRGLCPPARWRDRDHHPWRKTHTRSQQGL